MSEPATIRDGVVGFLRRELIGPDPRPEHMEFNGGEEILRPQDPPRLRYGAGVLFPSKAIVAQADAVDAEEGVAGEAAPPEGAEPESGVQTPPVIAMDDDDVEHEVNKANEFLPSAMGLTAMVRLPRRLLVAVWAGRYERRAVPGLGNVDKKTGKWQPHHWRVAVSPPPQEMDCSVFNPGKAVVAEYPLETGCAGMKLSLHVYSRPYARAEDPENDRILTITLINKTPMEGDHPKDNECFFQCGFSVTNPDGQPCFLEYPEREGLESDLDEQSLRLLHRHRKTFAVGHGCAAEWPDTEAGTVAEIRTECLPAYEIKPILPREIKGLDLSMKMLARGDRAQVAATCSQLASRYLDWINAQAGQVAGLSPELRGAADRHLELCRKCHERIVAGIGLLESDSKVRQAFSWMNEAMLAQQLHYALVTDKRRPWVEKEGVLQLESPYVFDDGNPKKGKWRPFQLAFILMNLASASDRKSKERDIVDLIWFPTGGGKTEAYLGLTAYTIFHRRLQNCHDSGTTVLMRYTLRLLTTQQFQRAASLICACELLRRKNDGQLGKTRISIGLWVGNDVTPNKRADALASLNAILREGKPNPFVVLTCPWCGAAMGPVAFGDGYKAKGYRRQDGTVIFRCEDPACDFRHKEGLPLLVVDEDIYEERPTLLIGTVDKFAMLPWTAEAHRLFGLDSLMDLSPPDLIIQDELHLISGALGSMVGMYETTIDALCSTVVSGQVRRAKIVASTATICQAPQQVRSLYARNVFLFPPQGLRAGDSFFAEEVCKDSEGREVPGRLYVGVFGSALSSHVTAQIRVMSALLQSVKCIPAPAPEALDPYWTLMAYFNSLRELGHAATLIRADIREYLNAVWSRLNIQKPDPASGAPDRRRFINRDLELTSRMPSNMIPDVLQELFNVHPGTDKRRPVDVCLATNMIQVGLDVPRLGLMTVVGQPKTTAEYIQATSRVGRDIKGPGLVVTVYNTAKPRDRSHFEHFRAYHQSIYRWVEPTSVTPFAIPVRERALHAQLVALARYWGPPSVRSSPNPYPPEDLVNRVREVLLQRIDAVDPAERPLAKTYLAEFLTRWSNLLPTIYGQCGGPPPAQTPLMHPSGTEPASIWYGRSKATPTSMRNVDSGCDAGVIQQFPKPAQAQQTED